MPRPKRCRRVGLLPGSTLFKPAGVPARELDEVVLEVDEFEALRLADYEGLYQEQAAERMGISRQTFGRIVEAARKKVTQALVKGLALRIEGGEVARAETRAFACADCGQIWEVPLDTVVPKGCPSCQGTNSLPAQGAEAGPCPGGGHCRRDGRGRRGGRAADQAQRNPNASGSERDATRRERGQGSP